MPQWDRVWDIGVLLLVVAGIMVFVREHSNGPALVNQLGGAFTGIVASAEGRTPTQPVQNITLQTTPGQGAAGTIDLAQLSAAQAQALRTGRARFTTTGG